MARHLWGRIKLPHQCYAWKYFFFPVCISEGNGLYVGPKIL